MDKAAVTRETIAATYELIRPHVRRTPLIEIDAADFTLSGRPLVFKLELPVPSSHAVRWRVCFRARFRLPGSSRPQAVTTD
jgi:hypothetical protein